MRSLVVINLLALASLAFGKGAEGAPPPGSEGAAVVVEAAPDTVRRSHYRLLPASALWIEGTTPVSRFTCRAAEVSGDGRASKHPLFDPARQVRLDATLAVPVRSFDCGQERMNRDFAGALRAEAHPEIEFRLEGAAFGDAAREEAMGAWRPVEAWGVLVLGGQQRPVRLLGEASASRAHLRARGSYPMRMSDFGVEPPAGPLGLIRARDHVLIHFDLYLAPYAPRSPGG